MEGREAMMEFPRRTQVAVGASSVSDMDGALGEDWVAAQDTALLAEALEDRVVDLRHRISGAQARVGATRTRSDLELLSAEVDALYDQLYAMVAAATHDTYTADDVRSWCERVMSLGCAHPRFRADVIRDLIYYKRVPCQRLREAVEAAENPTDLAHRFGERLRERGKRDCTSMLDGHGATSLFNTLGIRAHTAGKDKIRIAAIFMDYEKAVDLADVLGLAPHAIGI